MKNSNVILVPLTKADRKQFIIDNQWAFKYGALIEFGKLDNSVDEDGEIISKETIGRLIDETDNETYHIMFEGNKIGGVILKIDNITHHNHLEVLFVTPNAHSKGIGYAAWKEIEALHSETKIWQTCTPYYDKRNIHFYVNKCGFQIVEFCNKFHIDPNLPQDYQPSDDGSDDMFRFIKVMK